MSSQFVYSNEAATTHAGRSRSLLGSSGQSETHLSPPSSPDNASHAAAADGGAARAVVSTSSVSNETHAATAQNVSVNSMN